MSETISYKKIKKIYEGAEAEIFIVRLNKTECILKQRKQKKYREKLLDNQIITRRLRKEIKMYATAKQAGVLCPSVLYSDLDKKQIFMTYFPFPSFKKVSIKNKNKIKLLGKHVAKMHNNQIVHGDITLENVLFDPKQNMPVFIDFGLSFTSNKPDDFATDLFVFKETLCAEFPESYWNSFLNEYKKYIDKKEIISQLGKIEKRRRNA